jgi:methionyl-tRNA synthetase
MPDTPKKFYLTTPIYYVNARPHIGHAYSTIVADVLARRHRLLGDDTYFLTGTDEHGQKIERAAAAAGIPPQQYADQVSKTFSDLWHRMGITHNQFIRTTDPNHTRGVQKLFTDLYEKGQIYLSTYTGQYSVGEEMFVEGPPGTIGPDGRPTETVTEENFFFRLSDYQLPLLNLIESNELVITPDSSRNEVLAFLRGNTFPFPHLRPELHEQTAHTLIATEGSINRHIEADLADGTLARSLRGALYQPGALRDLSISRSSFTWGIPVPEEIQTAAGAKEKHVIYVWLDALTNYMTALGYGSDNNTLWQKFWPADLHLVGKEITRFHCVYWPAFLMAAGLKTPKQVTANGWLLFDNSKMSKSKGNVVRTETILDAFGTLCPPPAFPPNELVIPSETKDLLSSDTPLPLTESENRKGTASAVSITAPKTGALAPEGLPTKPDRDLFASDVLRYYLLREIPFGQDGSFSFDSLITRYNADLANGYGNLVSRVLKMIEQYFEEIPNCESPNGCENWNSFQWLQHFCKDNPGGNYLPEEESGEPHVSHILNEVRALHSFLEIPGSLVLAGTVGRIQALIALTDRYISHNAPWKLAKIGTAEARKQREEVLYTAAESIRIITALLYPILPFATGKVWKQLGFEKSIEQAAADGDLKNLAWGGLKPGTKLGPLSPIFPRADKGLSTIMTNLEDLASGNSKLATESTNPPSHPAASSQPEADKHNPPSFDPAAGPRTASLTEPGPLPVAGSTAHTTGPDNTPSHTEAQASGIFAQPTPSLTTNHSPLTTAPEITIDDFTKIELRVAQITLAERIPKADKLLRLEVDLGPLGQRQILSGIAEHYTPEDLTGRKIVVITNLAPRKMRGLESHGMLLAASDGDNGKPILATFAEDIPNGTRLK